MRPVFNLVSFLVLLDHLDWDSTLVTLYDDCDCLFFLVLFLLLVGKRLCGGKFLEREDFFKREA